MTDRSYEGEYIRVSSGGEWWHRMFPPHTFHTEDDVQQFIEVMEGRLREAREYLELTRREGEDDVWELAAQIVAKRDGRAPAYWRKTLGILRNEVGAGTVFYQNAKAAWDLGARPEDLGE